MDKNDWSRSWKDRANEERLKNQRESARQKQLLIEGKAKLQAKTVDDAVTKGFVHDEVIEDELYGLYSKSKYYNFYDEVVARPLTHQDLVDAKEKMLGVATPKKAYTGVWATEPTPQPGDRIEEGAAKWSQPAWSLAEATVRANALGRSLYYSNSVADDRAHYNGDTPRGVHTLEQANLIGSYIPASNMHAPVLDLDFGAQLVPSSTPGHFHLYLDHTLTTNQYKVLLDDLHAVGILEGGFRDQIHKYGFTAVRPPGVHKPVKNAWGASGTWKWNTQTLRNESALAPGTALPAMEDSISREELVAKDAKIKELEEKVESLYNDLARQQHLSTWQ